MFWKKLIKVSKLQFFGAGATMESLEFRGSYDRAAIRMKAGHAIRTGMNKRLVRALATQANSAITVGVGAVSSTNLLASAALAAAGTTTFLDAYSLGAGVLDYPRSIRFAAAASTGDASYTGAGAFVVRVVGTDAYGNVISESVALNSATVVYTKKAFKTVTALYPQIVAGVVGMATGITVGCGAGLNLGLPLPCQALTDLLEYGVKASAATGYTITTLPTTDVGEAYSVMTANITASDTAITITSGTGFPDGAQRSMAEIIGEDGRSEEIIITSRTTTALTVVRGVNSARNSSGTSLARAWNKGSVIAWRPGMTFTPGAITADDRFYLDYMSGVY